MSLKWKGGMPQKIIHLLNELTNDGVKRERGRHVMSRRSGGFLLVQFNACKRFCPNDHVDVYYATNFHLVNELPDDGVEVEAWPVVVWVQVGQLCEYKQGPRHSEINEGVEK